MTDKAVLKGVSVGSQIARVDMDEKNFPVGEAKPIKPIRVFPERCQIVALVKNKHVELAWALFNHEDDGSTQFREWI
jgi:hypothetical protein